MKGFGRQGGRTDVYRAAEYTATFIPKLTIEVVVNAIRVEKVIDAIVTVSRTGAHREGKVFVCTMDQVVRIRTGEGDAGAV